MAHIQCGETSIQTIGDLPQKGSLSPNFSVCNGQFRRFNLADDFDNKPLVLFTIPSIDTLTCMKCLHHFSQVADEKQINYLIVTSDTPFALQRLTANLPLNAEYVCTDMVLRELGLAYNLLIKSGPITSFLARAVFVLSKEHKIKYVELANDITSPINYPRMEEAIDRIC